MVAKVEREMGYEVDLSKKVVDLIIFVKTRFLYPLLHLYYYVHLFYWP